MNKLKALLFLFLLLPAIPMLGQSSADTGGTVVEGPPVGSGSGGSFTGGTLSSPLYLSEDPSQPAEAVTLRYLNQVLAPLQSTIPNVILSSGGTMSGNLVLPDGSPAASQLYVQNHAVTGGGSSFSLPTVQQVIAGKGDGTGIALPEEGVNVSGTTAAIAWKDDLSAGIYDPRDPRWGAQDTKAHQAAALQAMSNQMACDLATGKVKQAVAKFPQGAFAVDNLLAAPGSQWVGSPLADGGAELYTFVNNHAAITMPGSMTVTCSDGQQHTDSAGLGMISHFLVQGCATGGCTNASGDTGTYVDGGPNNIGVTLGTNGSLDHVFAQNFGGEGIVMNGQDAKAFHLRTIANLFWYYYGGYKGLGESAASAETNAATTGTTGSVTLSWAAVANATGYVVYRGTTAGAENNSFLVTTNSFTDTCAAGNTGAAGTVYNVVTETSAATPGTITATPSSTGGTCTAGTYYYKVTATTADGWHGSMRLGGLDTMVDWAEAYGNFDAPTKFTFHHLADILTGGGYGHFDHLWPQLGLVGIAQPYGYGTNNHIENFRVDFARQEGIWLHDTAVYVANGIVDGSCTAPNAATINTGQDQSQLAGTCTQYLETGVGNNLDNVWFGDNPGFGATVKTADIIMMDGSSTLQNTNGSIQFASGLGLMGGGRWWAQANGKAVTGATPSILGVDSITPTDATPITETSFTYGQAGQVFYVSPGNANVTIQNNSNIITCSGQNINLGNVKGPLQFRVASGQQFSTTVTVRQVCTSIPSIDLASQVTGNLPFANIQSESANTLLGAISNTTPSALPIPSCSGASNALTWTTGTGFGCNTITGGSGGTTVNTLNATSHLFVTSFNSSTGILGTAQPASTDLSDNSTVVHTSGNYTLTGTLTLADGSAAASQQYVANAVASVSGGGGTTTNQQLDTKITSASTPNKICTSDGAAAGTVSCGGVSGSPVSVTVQTAQSSPVLNNIGATGKSAQYGLTVNSTANTQILVPTTVGTNYQATVFKREMWFEGGSNLAGVDNFEIDSYMFDQPDQWEFMFGWQCNRHNTGFWQYDNFTSGWHNTSVACNITSGHIYHMILWMHRDAVTSTACTIGGTNGPCMHWDTFQLDDLTASTTNTYTLNATYPAESVAYMQTKGSNMSTWTGIGSQVQIDVVDSSASSSNPQLVSMYLDDDSLTTYVPVTSSGGSSQTVTETKGNLGEFDFDGSNPTSGLTVTGSPTLDTTNSYTSPNAALFNAASEYYTAPISPTLTAVFARFLINISTTSTANTRILELDNGSTQLFNLFLQGSNGYLTASDSANSASTTCSATAFPTGSWHTVELEWEEGATAGNYEVLIDGAVTCNVTGTNTGTSPVSQVKFGEVNAPATPWVFDLDNVGISSTGLLGAVTISTSGSLYDLAGAAAAVKASSLQSTNNLSDLSNGQAALSNLLNNPAPGTYTVSCVSSNSCTYAPVAYGSEVVVFSAIPTFSIAVKSSRMVLTGNVTSFNLGAGTDGQEHALCWKQGSGPYTVTPPSNVHGFAPVGQVSGSWSCQTFTYDAVDSLWLAVSAGVVNQ